MQAKEEQDGPAALSSKASTLPLPITVAMEIINMTTKPNKGCQQSLINISEQSIWSEIKYTLETTVNVVIRSSLTTVSNNR